MRNRTDVFLDKVQQYLKASFTERAKELGIKDIVVWDRGFNAVIDSMTSYPACLTFIENKNLSDITVTEYTLMIAIGVTADDTESLERLGNSWCDILEDSIRSDWHLGGACLDMDMKIDIKLGAGKGLYVIYTELRCSVDIGGFVYGESEVEVHQVRMDESDCENIPSTNDMPEMRTELEDGDTGEQE